MLHPTRPRWGGGSTQQAVERWLEGRGTKIALCNEHRAHVLHVSGYSRVERSSFWNKIFVNCSSQAHYPQMLPALFSANPDSCKLCSKRYSRKKMLKPREGFCWSWFYRKEHRVKKLILRHLSKQYAEWHRSVPVRSPLTCRRTHT